jgi:hypothetical protein
MRFNPYAVDWLRILKKLESTASMLADIYVIEDSYCVTWRRVIQVGLLSKLSASSKRAYKDPNCEVDPICSTCARALDGPCTTENPCCGTQGYEPQHENGHCDHCLDEYWRACLDEEAESRGCVIFQGDDPDEIWLYQDFEFYYKQSELYLEEPMDRLQLVE